jgi:hypothetical protein
MDCIDNGIYISLGRYLWWARLKAGAEPCWGELGRPPQLFLLRWVFELRRPAIDSSRSIHGGVGRRASVSATEEEEGVNREQLGLRLLSAHRPQLHMNRGRLAQQRTAQHIDLNDPCTHAWHTAAQQPRPRQNFPSAFPARAHADGHDAAWRNPRSSTRCAALQRAAGVRLSGGRRLQETACGRSGAPGCRGKPASMEEGDDEIVPPPAAAGAGHGRGGRGPGVGRGIGPSPAQAAVGVGRGRKRGSGKPVLKNPIPIGSRKTTKKGNCCVLVWLSTCVILNIVHEI